jgi:hypothetical protein
MSTRSRIGLLFEDGSVLSVYHHWDGYPEGLGAKLTKDYTTKEQVAELIDGGDISTCMSRSTWDGVNTDKEIVRYYSERGDVGVEPAFSETDFDFLQQTRNTQGEYAYVFNALTNQWSCYDLGAAEFVNLYEVAVEA